MKGGYSIVSLEEESSSDEDFELYRKVEDGVESQKDSGKQRFPDITVEVCIFLYGLAYSLHSVQVPSLYIEKTCKVGSAFYGNITFPDEICDNLSNGLFKDEQEVVQSIVAKEETICQVLMQVPVLIFALFMGPWSDLAGRKLLIMLPFFGEILRNAIFVLNVYFFDKMVVEFLWLEAITGFFGTWVILFLGAYGHLTDTTSISSRTLRIVVLDGMNGISKSIGSLANGPIFKKFGYYGSFISGFVINLMAFIIVVMFFDNKRKESVKTIMPSHKPFSLKNLNKSYEALFKLRDRKLRHILILLVTCQSLWLVGTEALLVIEVLLVRRKFDWIGGTQDMVAWWSRMKSYISTADIVSMFVAFPLMVKVNHEQDSWLS